jgi:BlaI family transcriptional regulator, penicillinase repressor
MARTKSPALTDAEARVMKALWRLKSGTVADLVGALARTRRTANYSTIQTILRILEGKGYVAHDKAARAFVYRPIVDESQARRRALRHLLTRLFDNSPSLLVQNVLDDEQLDPGELQRVKDAIDKA